MKTYLIKSENYRHFSLSENEREVGKLTYPKWFSFKADLSTDGQSYAFEPKGFWGTTIELKYNGRLVLNFKMHWNGQIIIQTLFNGVATDYVFKHKGILKSAYVLYTKEGEELVVLQPDYKWRTFSTDYIITASPSFEALAPKNILLLTMVHCANYYMNVASAGVVS
jgi:hypothetical protein